MQRMKKGLRRCAAVAAALGCLALLCRVPGGLWSKIGQQLAVYGAGLQQPDAGMRELEKKMVRTTACADGPKTAVTAPMSTTATVSPVMTTTAPPADPEEDGEAVGDGRILEQRLTTGGTFVQGVAVHNQTKTAVDVAALLKHRPAVSFDAKSTKPQVLIMHTHTTECYRATADKTYKAADATRTRDQKKNVVAVGEVLTEHLRAAGIAVLHDTKEHDYPAYNGAYSRSGATVKQYLKKYPSLRVVLDVHRDALQSDAHTRLKPTVTIGDRKAAQVMLVVGVMNTKTVPHPRWKENMSLALRVQQAIHRKHPGLIRPVNVMNARLNQQMTTGSLLLEVGGDANTLDEALYSAALVGDTLPAVLKGL